MLLVSVTRLADGPATFVLAAPLTGYKIVTKDYGPPIVAGATERYTVGSRHRLPASTAPCVRQIGLHFAVRPLALLASALWTPQSRLVRVVAPAGATVSADGIGYAASELHVVADETDAAPALLTGVLRQTDRDWFIGYKTYTGGVLKAMNGDDPYEVATWPKLGQRRKQWTSDDRGGNGGGDDKWTMALLDDEFKSLRLVGYLGDVGRDVWEARAQKTEWYESIAV
jgi:hypothetical protein